MICFPTIYTMKNKLYAIICVLISFANLNAQEFDLTTMIFQRNDLEYMGQLDWKQKNKNGTGIYKDGQNVYFGDFFDNKKSGYGMLVAGKKGKIKNLKDCMVYIGSWMDGKKQGKGICYDFNGKVIYQGKFENDKPTGVYPSQNSSSSKFSLISLEGGAYIGELTDGIPNGYGLFIANDGELSFGKVKDGLRYGTSLLLSDPYTWKIVKWDGDSYTEISNSDAHTAHLQTFKDANDKFWADIRSELKDVAIGLSGVATQYVEMKNSKNIDSNSSYSEGYSSSESLSAESNSSSSNNKKKSSVSSSKKASDCGTAWRTDSKNYSDLETLAMKSTKISEYQDFQSKMRRIREKWVSRGCHITKSEWETKPFGS